jgi:hypothetical protein
MTWLLTLWALVAAAFTGVTLYRLKARRRAVERGPRPAPPPPVAARCGAFWCRPTTASRRST